MSGKFDDLLNSTFAIPENEGENKVISLQEAVARYIKPGMSIHVGTTHCCPGAAILEIARQFHGKKPGFTIIMRGIRDTAVILLHTGLVRKVITGFSGNVYPWYSPNPVIQKAYEKKEVELEDWTILTFPLRLMAGALGTGFITTTSIIGSGMEKDNRDSFRVIDDPFGSGRKIGLLKALNPDISLVHGLAADREGNTILTPPYSESVWGAKAATGGAVVTVERLVSSDFIREHSHLVKLPGSMVRSVSIVPFGAHPGGVWNQGVEQLDAYAEDYAFMVEFNNICKDPTALNAWIKEWILDCPTFDDYRAKLGREKVIFLKGNADRDSWRYQLEALESEIPDGEDYTAAEMMVAVASREIQSRILAAQHKTMLAGAGTANLAAWLARYQLYSQNYLVELMVELGYYGNTPRPSEPYLLNFANFPTCKMLTETLDTLGVFTCGANNRCIGVLGGGQVDRFGNINSTWVGENSYLTGSGGANDVASGAKEVVLVMQQSRRRFMEKVPYITAPGTKARTLVSTMGVFEKLGNSEEFTLTKYFANPAFPTKEAAIRAIKDNCGWDLKVSPSPVEVAAPSLEELRLLRVFDPRRYYLR